MLLAASEDQSELCPVTEVFYLNKALALFNTG